MNFIGNKKAVNFLQRLFERSAINHAYLFSGPQQVGKLTLAKLFSQGIIATKPMSQDTFFEDKDAMLDLILLKPGVVEKKGIIKQRDIPIEAVREVQKNLSLFPYLGKYKVLIIDDAHRLSVAAQNALLKTLEEPAGTIVIILITHEADRILPTIKSRCQIVNFNLVEDNDSKEQFSKEASITDEILTLGMGRPGLLKVLLDNPEKFELSKEAYNQLKFISSGSLNEKLKLAEDFSKDVVMAIEKLVIWIWAIRKNGISKDKQSRQNSYLVIEKIEQGIRLLKNTNANGRLVLENLFIDM